MSPNHDDVDYCFVGRFVTFMVLAELPMVIEPGEGEAVALLRAQDDLELEAKAHGNLIEQLAATATVDQFGFIETPIARQNRGFDTLAIRTSAGRVLVPASAPSHPGAQRVMDAFPDAMLFPVPKKLYTLCHFG